MTLDPTDDVLLETDLDAEDGDETDEELEERIRRAIENARSVGEDVDELPYPESDRA
jgi:hypothetical protein